jgi:hypothetical protein
MYKLNILPVKLLQSPVSKNNQIFSHEGCDICGKQGILFEAISYKDNFDYNKLKYHSVTYKKYVQPTDPVVAQWIGKLNSMYIIYYLCSEECAMVVQLQQGD